MLFITLPCCFPKKASHNTMDTELLRSGKKKQQQRTAQERHWASAIMLEDVRFLRDEHSQHVCGSLRHGIRSRQITNASIEVENDLLLIFWQRLRCVVCAPFLTLPDPRQADIEARMRSSELVANWNSNEDFIALHTNWKFFHFFSQSVQTWGISAWALFVQKKKKQQPKN